MQYPGIQSGSYHDHGFVTLYAVLIIVALSSLAFTIGAVGLRQYQVVTIGANSQKAQYFAESGMECALYARLERHSGGADSIQCAGYVVDSNKLDTPQSVFFPGGGCVNIEYKYDIITALGYDRGTASGGCGTPGSGAQVERGFVERRLQGAIGP